MRIGSRIVVVVLVALSAACVHGRKTVPEREPVVLYVTNNYAMPVDVYASGGGTNYRMGTVLPAVPAHFTLRNSMLGDGPVEFVGFPADNSYTVRSGELLLKPGDAVDWLLTTQLRNSIATVRP
jgi:hypothetical protein